MSHETGPSERQEQKEKSRLRIKLLEIILQRVPGSAEDKWQHLHQIHTDRQKYTHTSMYKYIKIKPRTPGWVIFFPSGIMTLSAVSGKYINDTDRSSLEVPRVPIIKN